MFRKISSMLAFLSFIAVFICCFMMAGQIATGIMNGITLCLEVLIPSLFIFLVFSDLLEPMLYGRKIPRPLRAFAEKVLHMDGRLLYIFILGILGGYPIGAKLISGEVEKHHITKDDAQFLLRFCICVSPAFLVSSVARVLWNAPNLGWLIYGIQIIAAILIAFFSGRRHFVRYHPDNEMERSFQFSSVLVHSVQKSTVQMGMICGFVLLFSGLFSFIDLMPINNALLVFVKGISEVTVGCQMVTSLPAFYQPIVVCAFTAFGGICVHLQVMALCSKIPMKYEGFLFYRFVLMLISSALLWCYFLINPPVIDCFTSGETIAIVPSQSNLFTSFLLLLLCSMLLILFDRKSTPKQKNYDAKS